MTSGRILGLVGGAMMASLPFMSVQAQEIEITDSEIALALSSVKGPGDLVGGPSAAQIDGRPVIGVQVSPDLFFRCERQVDDTEISVQAFYDACREASIMISEPAASMMGSEEDSIREAEIQSGKRGSVCSLIGGKPAPAEGQTVAEFMRVKPLCDQAVR